MSNTHTYTVLEAVEAGGVEYRVPAGDGAEITATLLPDEPDDAAAYCVSATWGEIGPLDGVDAEIDALVDLVNADLPCRGGWSYDPANGVIVQGGAK